MTFERKINIGLKPEKNWRDNPYWKKKGCALFHDQIKIGRHNIKLLGWTKLPEDKKNALYTCIALLNPLLVYPTSYILLDDQNMPNPYNPSELCVGYRRKSERAIQFYPHVITSTKCHKELPEVSIWQGAIIHEFAHNQDFFPTIMEQWIQKFGWVKLGEAKIITAKDGSCIKIWYECEQPEKLITAYARYKPSEDFSESMVAALKCPNRLDTDKLAFLKNCFEGQ